MVSRLLAIALNNFLTMRDLLVFIVLLGRITIFELENNDLILEIIYGIEAMIKPGRSTLLVCFNLPIERQA